MPEESIGTIITSPPYMKSLTYARDNRLRLWFLGVEDWKSLDKKISPEKNYFYKEMEECFLIGIKMQTKEGRCIMVIGNFGNPISGRKVLHARCLAQIAAPYYSLRDALC